MSPARIATALVALAAVCVAPRTATAQRPPPASSAKPALARVADALAPALAPARARGRVVVVAAPLVSDGPAPRAAELTAAIAAQLAGRLGPAARSRPEPLSLPAARAAARSDGGLIHLVVAISGGKLRVTADRYPVPRSVWAKIRDPEPGPVAHAFADAPIDAEVRAFLAPIPLVAASVDRAKNFESDVTALACGDLDQDGSLEIVAVSRRRVTIERLRGGRVQVIVSRSWTDLAPVAPAPLREPFGFATIVPPFGARPSVLDVALTDRARSVRLDAELRVVAAFGGMAVPDGEGSACTRVPGLVVTGPLAPCVPGDPAPRAVSVGGQYDAFASARLVSKRGEPYAVWAGRERGSLELRDDAGHRAGLEVAGAQLAVGDLDQDGEPEVITSQDTMSPLDDAVVVRKWVRDEPIAMGAGPSARLHEIMRIPAAAGVRAIAVCPPDGPGRAPFVVATSDELWVVR